MPHVDIEPDELRKRLAVGEPVFVLDVREPSEVATWAFPGATNIPLGQVLERAGELPTDRPIVAVCHAGARSAMAADALNEAGWSVENLAGGALAWIDTEPFE